MVDIDARAMILKNASTTAAAATSAPPPPCSGAFDALDCVPLVEERQFLAVVILALACAVCAIGGMIGIVGMQVKRLAELLRAAREAAQPDTKTGLLASVSGRLTPKKSKKTTFEDTSCAGPRDPDEEEI